MSVPDQEVKTEPPVQSDKEINFQKQRQMYERQLEQERQARAQAEQRATELEKMKISSKDDDDDDDSEPYIDKKRLKRETARVKGEAVQESRQYIQQEVAKALEEERKTNWLKANPDFTQVMEHAQTLADRDPELAETILSMPAGFERQKLVYKNIKALGLHKKPEPEPSIQTKIDANRRSPYYQPSGVGSSPYASQGDFSPAGQKNAYDQMQALKAKLRI